MRRLLCLFALIVVPVLLADDKKTDPAPNTLTKEEIQAGWLLLFDGETTFGWKIDGEAKVEKGVLILGGDKETKAEPTIRLSGYNVEFEWSREGKEAPSWDGGGLRLYQLSEQTNGKFLPQQIYFGTLGRPRRPLAFIVPAGSKLHLRNVKLQPFGLQDAPKGEKRWNPSKKQRMDSLFNGKDLTGWKVFKRDPKREKSKYTVTKEGWLNVKDGPGDIQTEKKFDDFVLQLECLSNGKHLNSGIFFRAIPGEYWMGYEAQIRNEFTDKPTQKYTIEEFDPKTNKSTGKKAVLSTAVDYGTGAIYRRMPARKQASKDGEWFTMTVVARERHIATWVNGIPMVDWTDNRPADKNARKGYCGDAGAISIQGHDKTTDLSFRNIRVGELKREKK